MPDPHFGTIVSFKGSWGSGIATLVVEDDNHIEHPILCENAPTVRALDACFGDVITPNHSVNQSSIVGQSIVYFLDDMMGMLSGFTTEDEYADWLLGQEEGEKNA